MKNCKLANCCVPPPPPPPPKNDRACDAALSSLFNNNDNINNNRLFMVPHLKRAQSAYNDIRIYICSFYHTHTPLRQLLVDF